MVTVQEVLCLSAPKVSTEIGKKDFQYASPSSWNDVQNVFHLSHLVTLGESKSILNDRVYSSVGHCN